MEEHLINPKDIELAVCPRCGRSVQDLVQEAIQKERETPKVIQIHKNYFKKHFELDWNDIPELLTFETNTQGWIQINPLR